MKPEPPCSAPTCWWPTGMSGLLLCWELPLGALSVGFIYLFIYFPLLVMLPSEIPKLPTDPPVRGSPGAWKLLFKGSLPGMGFCPYLFCLSFYLLYFVLPPFEDNGLPFWVPDVVCPHSEVVLWNFLSIQMFFWWICGGESGLPFLFLCHLRTAPPC